MGIRDDLKSSFDEAIGLSTVKDLPNVSYT
jgi:thiaminase (transcriptional activator TenA)